MIRLFNILFFFSTLACTSIAQNSRQYLTTYWINSYYQKNLYFLIEILSDVSYYPNTIEYNNNFPIINIKRTDLVMISLFVDGKQITPYHLTGISIQPPLGPGCAWAQVYPDTIEKRYKFVIEDLSKKAFLLNNYSGVFYFIFKTSLINNKNVKIQYRKPKKKLIFKWMKFIPNNEVYILSFSIIP